MPTFRLFLNIGDELHWLADVEAESAAAARATQPLQCVSFEFDRETGPLVGVEIKPSGQYCVGLCFDVADDAGDIIANYRKCGWDNEITAPQISGEKCSECLRIIRDPSPVGVLHSVAVNARYVYFERFKIWQLVQVP